MKASHVPHAAYRREGDGYAIYADDYRLFGTDEVALMVNKQGHLLVFHGRPEDVQRKYAQMAQAVKRGDPALQESFENFIVLSGKFEVAMLNQAISTRNARAIYAACEVQAARDASQLLARLAQASAA